MRSGFPHSQGGAYSVFQDWSNVGVFRLPQDINVTPVPVVHPEIGIQNNMVVTQNTEEHRVTYSQVPLQQQEYRSQRLYHQQESQGTIIGSGFQHPRPRDGACIFQNMQKSRKDHDDFYSAAPVAAHHSRYFGTLAYENSVRQSDSNSWQQKEHSKQNVSWHFKKKLHQNHDTGLQLPQDKDQRSSVAVCNNITSLPLLEALLKTNSSELPCSEETNGNIELHTNTNYLNKRLCQSLQVKSLLNVLNCGQTTTQNLDYSRGTPSTPYQQQVSSRCISSRPSTDKLVSAGKTHPPTDIEIQDFVAQKLIYFRSILRLKNNNPGHTNKDLDRNSTLQPDRIQPKVDSVAHLPTTSAKDVDSQSQIWEANEQCKVGQALKQDSSNDSKVNAKSVLKAKDTGDCATSASEKHSKGTAVSVVEHSKYPLKNASVDKSASVDFDLSVKKHLDATMPADDYCKHVCSDDCEDETCVRKEYGFYSKGCDKYIQNGLKTIHYSLTALKELIASLENVEDIAEMENLSKVILQQYWNGNIDNIHLFTSTEYPRIMMDVAATCTKNEDESPVVLTAVHELTEKEESLPDVSEDLQTKSSSETSENKTFKLLTLIENQDANTKEKGKIEAEQQCCDTWKERNSHSKLNSGVDSIQIHNVVSLLINQSEGASKDAGSVRLQTDLSTGHSENNEQVVKNPLYEDISDDEPSQPATNLTTEQFLAAGSEDPQYRDISEAENPQRESMAMETSSPAQVAAPNNTQSPFENEGYGHLQGQTQTNTVTISDELVPKKQVSPDTETRVTAPCSYTFVETGPLCDSGPFSEEETDGDGDDDDWLFIPVSISDLKFKSHNVDQDSPERRVLDGGERPCDTSPTYWTSPKPLSASPSQIETFDTLESLKQAFSKRFGLAVAGSTPELEIDSEGKLETTDNRRESLDFSCETEDSWDYSSASEHRYLTVSRMRSAPLPSETIDSEGEDNDVTNMDIIILDSDDESDQNCKKKAETKGRPKAMDSQCGTVTKKCERNRVAPQHHPVHHDTPFEEVMQDACIDLSPSTETIGQLIETKAVSEHVQRKTKRKRISKEKSVVIIDSDSDTDDDSWISWHCF
ncbi:uncharacterized protein LOC116673489 isoform X2 [Etheostoma spectabile]|uniref:uncharacterized protein LOC116673489 isoform X2 n=1 Tax=Etheostoma spectabile TaxID=54343 RepID=UPI0013AFA94A|nr:uncharacterized protein LOC116673489 isoform X2 [Etheostoma spectabile]